MSNKLTIEGMDRWIAERMTNEQIFESIEKHTAECVAEAVAEVKKDHFRIGEMVEYRLGNLWGKASIVAVIGNPEDWSVELEREVRRPPRTRTMTDEELTAIILREAKWPQKYSRPTLEAMAKDLGIALEVSDE